MEINKWYLREQFISQLKQYRFTHMYKGAPITFNSIIALLDIIPDELLDISSCKFTPRVEVYSGFKNIQQCQDWLYLLNVDLTNQKFFKENILKITFNKYTMSLEDFLVDERSMSYVPLTTLTTLRRTIMDCAKSYDKIKDCDMLEYYDLKLKGLLPEVNHIVQCFANLALEVEYE